MRYVLILCGLVAAAAANGPAYATDVATFLAKVEAVKGKGVMAMFSSDLKLLMGEIGDSMTELKEERLAAVAGGRRPIYCPNGKAELSRQELFAAMEAVSPARRPKVQVKEALRAGLARKYPCREAS